MATAGTLEYLISIDSSSVNSGLGNAESKVKNFGNKMSSWAVAKGQILGRMIERAGAATMRFVKGSVQESMSFDKAMSQVAATLGKSTSEVQDLAKFARKMGSETAFTAEEAAQGLNYMALAGYDATTSMKMLPTVLNLAAAGNMELARASDMVTDAQSALGLSLEDTTVLIDQMAKASSKTNTSVEQLGDAILTVGGTAKMLNGGTKELTMTLGVLADNGIKGSEGGTALRNTILALSAPTDKAAKRLKELNVEVYDAEGNMRGLPDIMSDMNDAMKGMSQQQRTEILNDIFNKRDLKAAEALLGTSKKRWAELGAEIGNAKGAAAEMAETQLDNLAGDVTKFKSALGETRLTIVEKLTPALRTFVKGGTVLVQRLTEAFRSKGLLGAVKELATNLSSLGRNIVSRAKIKLSQWLELGDDASWGDIALGVVRKLKSKIQEKKIKIAEFLHIPNAEDASWADIARQVAGNIKTWFSTNKIKIAELLDVPNAEDATWSDIAGNIIDRLTQHIGRGGEFIKKLILGESYQEGQSTWQEVGSIISGWITDGFKEDGWVTKLLKNAGEQAGAIAEFAGTFISGLATWIGDNPQTIVDLVTSVINAIAGAVEPIVNALVTIINDPKFKQALGSLGAGIIEAIFGEDLADKIRALFGLPKKEKKKIGKNGKELTIGEIEPGDTLFTAGENGRGFETNVRKAIWYYMSSLTNYRNFKEKNFADSDILPTAAQIDNMWSEYMGGVLNQMGYDYGSPRFKELMDEFSIDKMTTAYRSWSLGGDDYIETLKQNLKNQDFYDVLGDLSAPVEIEPVVPENAASTIAEAIGEINIPVNLVPNGLGTLSGMGKLLENFPGFAKGNWNVPYDNYPALLHRGEMVLNKSQARSFRDSEGGSFDMNSIVGNAVSAAMSKVYVMLNGDKVGDLTSKRIGKNINATTYNKLRALGG